VVSRVIVGVTDEDVEDDPPEQLLRRFVVGGKAATDLIGE